MHSGNGITEMFYPRETGCNSHVSVHGFCHVEQLTSRAYMFIRKRRDQGHFRVLLSNTFQRLRGLEVKDKVVCYIHTFIEKKSRNSGIAISSFKPNVQGNWVWLNYDATEQQLRARGDD